MDGSDDDPRGGKGVKGDGHAWAAEAAVWQQRPASQGQAIALLIANLKEPNLIAAKHLQVACARVRMHHSNGISVVGHHDVLAKWDL